MAGAMTNKSFNRRRILQMLAGGAYLASTGERAFAAESRIDKLLVEAKAHGGISQRVDFISGALRGTRYRGYTLIGGPHRSEEFVVRDDAFDCVTFCETVLAAAIARQPTEFKSVLRAIRYHNGIVSWRERNHYFFEWGEHNVENKTCQALAMDGSVTFEKTVYWHRALGKRRFAMKAIPRDVFMANTKMLADGDIIGFVTTRPDLDYFHVGFVSFARDGELLLRHASKSRHRVLDERMDRFVADNRVRYVTLLRPEEPGADAVAARKDG